MIICSLHQGCPAYAEKHPVPDLENGWAESPLPTVSGAVFQFWESQAMVPGCTNPNLGLWR